MKVSSCGLLKHKNGYNFETRPDTARVCTHLFHCFYASWLLLKLVPHVVIHSNNFNNADLSRDIYTISETVIRSLTYFFLLRKKGNLRENCCNQDVLNVGTFDYAYFYR